MTDPMRTSSQWCLKSIALLTAAAKARQKKLIWIAATMKVLEMRGWTYIAEMKIKLRGFMPTTHADGEDRRNLSLEVQDAPGGCREGVARVTRHEALALILQFSLHVLFVEYLLTHKKLVQRCWHILFRVTYKILVWYYRQISVAMVVSDVKWPCILGAVDLRPSEIADGEEVGPQSATSDLSKGTCNRCRMVSNYITY